jgi:protein SCO1/2
MISFFGWCAVLALVLAARPAIATSAAGSQKSANSLDYLPQVELRDQSGHQVSLASLRGKPVVVGFIHTSCEGVCQLMTAKMKTIAQEFDPGFGSKLTMVSITTDPREDRPPQLRAYAKEQGATGNGWLFLTGKPAAVRSVLKLYGVNQDMGDDEMTHVFDLFLIGPDGHELRHYHGSDIKLQDVTADIRTALAHR